MKSYPPMEIMREETSRAVMNGLLIHDLTSTADTNTASPDNPLPGGDNPIHLTMHGAFHGGEDLRNLCAYNITAIALLGHATIGDEFVCTHILSSTGVWRGGFKFDTIGPAAATAVYLRQYTPQLLLLSTFMAGVFGVPAFGSAIGVAVSRGFKAFAAA